MCIIIVIIIIICNIISAGAGINDDNILFKLNRLLPLSGLLHRFQFYQPNSNN